MRATVSFNAMENCISIMYFSKVFTTKDEVLFQSPSNQPGPASLTSRTTILTLLPLVVLNNGLHSTTTVLSGYHPRYTLGFLPQLRCRHRLLCLLRHHIPRPRRPRHLLQEGVYMSHCHVGAVANSGLRVQNHVYQDAGQFGELRNVVRADTRRSAVD